MKGYEHLGYSLTHVCREQLIQRLDTLVAQDRTNTAQVLAHIAEIDHRGDYRDQGYPSMFAYCIGRLRMCEQSTYKRIFAARTARRFPAIFVALADGRLHLSAVVMISTYLTPENFESLIAAVTHKSRAEIERFLADLRPKPDVPERVSALPTAPVEPAALQLSPGKVETTPNATSASSTTSPELSPGKVGGPIEPGRVAPLGLRRFALQTTVSEATYEKLQHVKNLLGHQVGPGDLASVLDRALDALIAQLERRKFGATTRPQAAAKPPTNPRTIPAAVRRTVHARDGGRCAFVSHDGRRCDARSHLEFDHVIPVASGGASTEANVRLLCRAHNQLEADRAFGTGFMSTKRLAAS